MSTRALFRAGLVLAALSALAIAVVDRSIAELVHRSGRPLRDLFWHGTDALEVAFLWPISKFALAFLLIAAGIGVRFRPAWRPAGRLLLLLGVTNLVARLLAGSLKNVFERLRPHEVIAGGHWDAQWFTADGNSFPSTHAAHFWSFAFVLAHAFPRARWPLAAVPVFVSLARVGLNDHFASDVLAGAAIAALLSWVGLRLTRPAQGRSH